MMSLKKYFRNELDFLKQEGKEFARVYPHLSHFLSDEAIDPDVERLLEGFAFLSARLRQKVDDDFPELTFSILNLLWPNYLRPVPSCTIMQFEAVEGSISRKQLLKRNTLVESHPVDDTQCQFSTCMDVDIYPLEINDVKLLNTREKSVVTLDFNVLTEQPLNKMGCEDFTLHLAGEDYTALTTYLWIFNYLKKIDFVFGDNVISLSANHVRRVGFSPEEALLPYPKNVFDGYRILQEFFSFPRRFYFFNLFNLSSVWPDEIMDGFKVEMYFDRPMPNDILMKSRDFLLHCTPAVNLFDHSADPINLTGEGAKYRLTPFGPKDHYEVFSVEKVTGIDVDKVTNTVKGERIYSAFETFQHEVERSNDRTALYYKLNVSQNIDEESFDHSLSFVRGDESLFFGANETVSIDLKCTNRDLPDSLAVGDVCLPSQTTPSFVKFRNVIKPTRALRPVLDGSLHWTLISNFSLNYLSLLQADLLKNVIRSYDFLAMHDVQAQRHTAKRLEAIKEIVTQPVDVFFKNMPVRGMRSLIKVEDQFFTCEGELYLFGTVLAEFFGLYASINSFHQLEIHNLSKNEFYKWEMQIGQQPVI